MRTECRASARDGGDATDGGGARRTIPYIETSGPLDLVGRWPERVNDLLAAGTLRHGRIGLAIGERLSRRWLDRCRTPYRGEVLAVAEHLGRPGATLLNLSYEWTCTTGVAGDPHGIGNRMLRTLDWPMSGLGRDAVVARHEGPAGAYYNVTWPGFIGVLTAMAPGRFAAAINQPPHRRYTPLQRLDWAINRHRVWRSDAMPPAHLLRHVFETCATYGEAKAMLTEEAICLPVFFTLSGTGSDEGCVIERLETSAKVHEGETGIANHFVGLELPARLRGRDSHGRLRLMRQLSPRTADGFDWVVPPILNAHTRLAVVANAARGTLHVQGWEGETAVTEPWALPMPGTVAAKGPGIDRAA